MNLQTHVRPELWLAIANTYQSGNYSHAILDAMHYLSNFLRDRTGVDGDGVSLVGQSLGGTSPRLRVNKLQTETERDVQKGVEHLLRGLYWAVRNPRSHEQVEDSQDTADAVVYFVNYLLGILAQSEQPFTTLGFLSRVFDPDFVASDRYATLLATEIPANKRLDTLIEIYRRKMEGDGKKLRLIVASILNQLSENQIADFLAIVSDELKVVLEQGTLIRIFQLLQPDLWPRLNEAARLRIENKILQSIREGKVWYHNNSEKLTGLLGTWAASFIPYFVSKQEVSESLIFKLVIGVKSEQWYVAKYFLVALAQIVGDEYSRHQAVTAIANAVRQEVWNVRRELAVSIHDLPEIWQKEFVTNLRDLTDSEKPLVYLSDGTPFLTLIEEDIPFE